MNYVIDTDDYVASGIEVFPFPGGEWHANVPAWPYRSVNVHAKIRTWEDMGKLLVVLSAFKGQRVSVHLFSPYLPGLRQDRNPGGLTPLTSELYGLLLHAMVASVTVADPHSEGGMENFKRALDNKPVHVLKPDLYLPNLLPLDTYDYVIQPDKGAEARTSETAKILGLNPRSSKDDVNGQILVCEKHREFGTGKLAGFKIPERVRSFDAGTRILLPDDICDGGGTFLGLFSIIKDFNPDVIVDLFVTHGIFSNDAIDRLIFGGFNRIYTTDSWFKPNQPRHVEGVTSIELLPYYLGGLHP